MKKKLLLLTFIACILLCGCENNNQPNVSNITDVSQSQEVINTDNDKNSTNSEKDLSKASNDDTTHEQTTIFLKDIYSKSNILTGTCLSPEMLKNPDSEKLILEQFNSITMENAMKPEYILNKQKSKESGEIVVEFNDDAISMLDWCKQNKMAVRGHTLIWYSQTPDWIFYEDFDESKELVSREVMLNRMESFIKQVFDYLIDNEYADLFYAYDIVNEAWMEDKTLRDNYYRSIIGDDYLWYAFYYARLYAPDNIKLFYNDYNEQYKARTIVDFTDSLVDDNGNSLIDGIGLQAHLYTLDDMNKYLKSIDILNSTGLIIEITELDVSLGTWQNTLDASEDNLKAQGKFYYNLINSITEKVASGSLNLDSITFWGFNDSLSWRKEASPLLFDKMSKPKYSFYGAALDKEHAGF